MADHHYESTIRWTGNRGSGTIGYRDYDRDHVISIDHKSDLACSSDAAFRGDKTRHNPEDFLVSSIAACHMLWYLHLCADAGVVVLDYVDRATGIMAETAGGGGRFTEVTLHPSITVQDPSMIQKAIELHSRAHDLCFITASVNFPVLHQPTIVAREMASQSGQ